MRTSFLTLSTLLVLFNTAWSQTKPITNNEIIEMLKAGISESVIIEKIKTDGCDCDTSAVGLMTLKGANASDELVRAIINARKATVPTPAIGQQPTGQPTSYPTQQAQPSSYFEPKGFAFGGFSYARAESLDLNWWGGHGQVGVFVTDWLAIAGDVSYHHAGVSLLDVSLADVSALSFTAGPQFGNRYGKVKGFGHVLVGGIRLSASEFTGTFDGSTVEFSSTVGAGVDVNLTDHFAIRVVEADWLRIWQGDGLNIVRLSFGVVGRF